MGEANRSNCGLWLTSALEQNNIMKNQVDKMNIMKIVAREGLIILGITILTVTIYLFGSLLITLHKPPAKEILTTEELFGIGIHIKGKAFYLLYAYPLYLLIRFVFWAIKTLKKTE
jgi:hypothetical protein